MARAMYLGQNIAGTEKGGLCGCEPQAESQDTKEF